MKFLLGVILLYSIIYKFYFINYGEIFTYIINPIVWLIFLILTLNIIKVKKRPGIVKKTLLDMSIILSLIYTIIYYSLGIFFGLTNNPYDTSLNGVIINLFSILMINIIKEIIRYKFISNMNLKVVFLIFTIMDINIIGEGIFNIIFLGILKPVSYNLFMTFLTSSIGYEASISYVIINLLPTLFLSVTVKYDYFVIILLNSIFYLFSYIIIKYIKDKEEKKVVFKKINIKKTIPIVIGFFLFMSFNLGLFSLQPIVILSGSMKPLFKEGDLIITKKCDISDINIGDVIEYKKNNYKVIHRVVNISYNNGRQYIITKGDNNKDIDDPVYEEQIIGKMEFIVPYLGYPTYLIKNILKG